MPSRVADQCEICSLCQNFENGSVVYQNERLVVFMQYHGTEVCQVLLIPREHVHNMLDLSPVALTDLMNAAWLVSRAVPEVTGTDGLVLLSATETGPEKGDSGHFHLHLACREAGDSQPIWMPPGRSPSREELAPMTSRFRLYLSQSNDPDVLEPLPVRRRFVRRTG